MNKRTLVLMILFSFFIMEDVLAYTSHGEPDTGFGSGGVVLFDAGDDDAINALAIQEDGLILTAGSAGGDFFIARHKKDGSPDLSFGSGGISTFDNDGKTDEGEALAIQKDGKIVVAGNSGDKLLVVRFDKYGRQDYGFGTNRRILIDFDELIIGESACNGVVVQEDGKIIVAGAFTTTIKSRSAMLRMNPDGTLDTGFGNLGVAFDLFDSSSEGSANALALGKDGRIVVAGSSDGDFAVACFKSNGKPDTEFNVTGIVKKDIGGGSLDEVNALALGDNDFIILGGTSSMGGNNSFAVARVTDLGIFDYNFSTDGFTTACPGSGADCKGWGVALQRDGKILVGGYYSLGGEDDIGVVRFLRNGDIDTEFGNGNVARAGLTDAGANAMALQANQKVIAGGFSIESGFSNSVLAGFVTRNLIFVDGGNTGPVKDGSSWAKAFNTIGEGMSAAGGNDSILVKAGEYPEKVVMADGVILAGGFDGTETAIHDRDWETNRTVINAEDSGTAVTGGNFSALNGFVITGGKSDGLSHGGGMHNSNLSFITVENCIFEGNNAFCGGGIKNEDCGSVDVMDCRFISNSSIDNGGALANENGWIYMYGVIFDGNYTEGINGRGGAVYLENSESDIINSIFHNNSASITGGGISLDWTELNIINCTLVSNFGSSGSAVYSGSDSAFELINSIVWGNSPVNDALLNVNETYKCKIKYSDVQGADATGYYDSYRLENVEGNISVDPGFNDQAGGDLNLKKDSPCIDKGSNEYAPEFDYEWDLRHNISDMGADEYILSLDPGVYYVDGAVGDDTNSGLSLEEAFKTIHHAVWGINNGGVSGVHTLKIIGGVTYKTVSAGGEEPEAGLTVYQDNLVIEGVGDSAGNLPIISGISSTSWHRGFEIVASDVTIKNCVMEFFEGEDNGPSGSCVSILGGSGNKTEGCIMRNSGNGVILENPSSATTITACEIQSNGYSGIAVKGSSFNIVSGNNGQGIFDNGFLSSEEGAGIKVIAGASHNQIKNNLIRSQDMSASFMQPNGVLIEDAGEGNEITGNSIAGHKNTGNVGVSVMDSGISVERNIFSDNVVGIALISSEWEDPATDNSANVLNNLMLSGNTAIQEFGITIHKGGDMALSPKVMYNTFDGGGGSLGTGISVKGGATPSIFCNIITGYGGGIDSFSGAAQIEYNDLFDNEADYREAGTEKELVGEGNIFEDPLFIGSGDYHLQAGSPCVEAVPVKESYEALNDHDLRERPLLEKYDMGCFESESALFGVEVEILPDDSGRVETSDTISVESCDSKCPYSFTSGASLTFTAVDIADSGHIFDHWKWVDKDGVIHESTGKTLSGIELKGKIQVKAYFIDPDCPDPTADRDGDTVPDCLDGCPDDAHKTDPGQCGCGVSDEDTDKDGTADCKDNCPGDINKTEPGQCGCGVSDEDTDKDGIPDCKDGCPQNGDKIAPGICGCSGSESDSDGDGVPDCVDNCPNNPNKTGPGVCGCEIADTDTDGDQTPDCRDNCPNDKDKREPGVCGCGVSEADSDGDGTPDCKDNCPTDKDKIKPGICGCGIRDIDSDNDGVADCHDLCPNDPLKTAPGACGCNVPDRDSDGDGHPDCVSDNCPDDPDKTEPGICGCGKPDNDTDNDGVADCLDLCPDDPLKRAPGTCGCNISDNDRDGDGVPDCVDGCPDDAKKSDPGKCGCGLLETDRDNDNTPDCEDLCPDNPEKTEPGQCGCDISDEDADGDGFPDCLDNRPPFTPEAVFPEDNATVKETDVTLKAGEYLDPENDGHILTHWMVRLANGVYGEDEYHASFEETAAGEEKREHTVKGLAPGQRYIWKVGYADSGSGMVSWSREYTFTVGEIVEDEEVVQIPRGSSFEDYLMISFTYWQIDSSAEAVFGEVIGDYDTKKIRIGAYDPLTGGYTEYGPDLKIVPGKAYWVLSRDFYEIKSTGVPVSREEAVKIPLLFHAETGNGWNMISPPNRFDYLWEKLTVVAFDSSGNTIFGPVLVGELEETNGYLDIRIWRWNNGEYDSEASVVPGNGGLWVKALKKSVYIRFTPEARVDISNPENMAIYYLEQGKKYFSKIFPGPEEAIADVSEGPPMPMSAFNNAPGLDVMSRVDNGGGCFIEATTEGCH